MSENLTLLANAFYNSFNNNHVILYVGQSAREEEIKEYLSACPWSCVITSRREDQFSGYFASEDRHPREIESSSGITVNPLNRKDPFPVLRLCGREGSDANVPEFLKDNMGNAGDLLRLLPGLLQPPHMMVMVGIDSNKDQNLIRDHMFLPLYEKVADGAVSIWGCSEAVTAKDPKFYNDLKTIANARSFQLYQTSLTDVIASRKREFAEYEEENADAPGIAEEVYYQAKDPVHISQEELLQFKNVGVLLTEQTVRGIRPLGRIQQQKWYSTFLETSSVLGPQWYGYLPQSTFYVKRSYEDTLFHLVRLMLEGKGLGRYNNCPVILHGDPGSSKSITLAALAFRIYSDKKYPVIFISDESFLGSNISTETEALNQVMHQLEMRAKTDTRILVIWDSSSYRTGVERAKQLNKALQDKGRRFVLVCSGYSMFGPTETANGKEKDAYYRLNGERFEECSSREDAQVTKRAGTYYIKSTRRMNENEQVNFWKNVKEYSGIPRETISFLEKKLKNEGQDDIFEFYYQIVSLLRENLEHRLTAEQNKVYQYVNKELKKIVDLVNEKAQEVRQYSPMYQALLKAGIPQEDLLFLNEAQEDLDNLEVRLERFNICLALFSRFKLEVPYSLAYAVLSNEAQEGVSEIVFGESKTQTKRFSQDDQALFRAVIDIIPWIYCGETETGGYALRFRNAREAEIYLRRHDFNGDRQIELLCKILDMYKENYLKNGYVDIDFTRNLQALLRLMGPNSTYPPFNQEGSFEQLEHKRILEKLNILIDKVKDLIDERQLDPVPDETAGFAAIIVTFTREYYGKKPKTLDDAPNAPEAYQERIGQIKYAIGLAEKSISQIESRMLSSRNDAERKRLRGQINSLIVETAHCIRLLRDMWEEYATLYDVPASEFDDLLLSNAYQRLQRKLSDVIENEPTNGYAYNALFSLFEQEYTRKTHPLKKTTKLQYLSQIMQLVERCRELGAAIVNRGGKDNDEISKHIHRISDYSNAVPMTIETIERHMKKIPPKNQDEENVFKLYDEMLERNDASTIMFVCQKELQELKQEGALNAEDLKRCKRVRDFMMQDVHSECISSNAYALETLIRVCWMLYNGRRLNPALECQVTRLQLEQWKEIHSLGKTYDDQTGDGIYGDAHKQPIIMLLYALSAIQIAGPETEAGYRDASNILRRIDEGQFLYTRMHTPFMICREDGTPYTYTGTVTEVKGNNGHIHIHGMNTRSTVHVRFWLHDLGRRTMPEPNEVIDGLELGIRYTTSFSAYTKSGREYKEKRGAR